MLEVCTGSRLHFGLMELAEGESLRFGGLGLMLEEPRWRLRFSPAARNLREREQSQDGTTAANEIGSRIQQVLTAVNDVPKVDVQYVETLALHNGLGSGTQLASATAVGQLLFDRVQHKIVETSFEWKAVENSLPELTPHQLATISGRGLRSAVGLQGFLTGGLILDEGYEPSGGGRQVATHSARLPEDWRVVLVRPATQASVSGDKEATLLDEIARSPNPHRSQMYELACNTLQRLHEHENQKQDTSDFFGLVMVDLEHYMHLAARMFEGQQGGLYNGDAIARAVEQARRVGLRGVGQSSWGPTVFGFAPTPDIAAKCARELGQGASHLSVSISKPAAGGAQWRTTNNLDAR